MSAHPVAIYQRGIHKGKNELRILSYELKDKIRIYILTTQHSTLLTQNSITHAIAPDHEFRLLNIRLYACIQTGYG